MRPLNSVSMPPGGGTPLGRRQLLRLLLPSLGVIGFHLPAQASSQAARALVLSCIDFRFVSRETILMQALNLEGQYDWTALAGASLALADFPHPCDATAFWDQLALAHQLHQIQRVIILDHQDCGAYAARFGSRLAQDPERERHIHAEYLHRAARAIQKRYPSLGVDQYFVTLTGETQRLGV